MTYDPRNYQGSPTGRIPREPEMQRLPGTYAKPEQREMPGVDFASIEARILAAMPPQDRKAFDMVQRMMGEGVDHKTDGADHSATHELQRVAHGVVTGRMSHTMPNGARSLDQISKRGCDLCDAKAGEGHQLDCPRLTRGELVIDYPTVETLAPGDRIVLSGWACDVQTITRMDETVVHLVARRVNDGQRINVQRVTGTKVKRMEAQ